MWKNKMNKYYEYKETVAEIELASEAYHEIPVTFGFHST